MSLLREALADDVGMATGRAGHQLITRVPMGRRRRAGQWVCLPGPRGLQQRPACSSRCRRPPVWCLALRCAGFGRQRVAVYLKFLGRAHPGGAFAWWEQYFPVPDEWYPCGKPSPGIGSGCRRNWYFPNGMQMRTLKTHAKYFLFSASFERAGTLGFRCASDSATAPKIDDDTIDRL